MHCRDIMSTNLERLTEQATVQEAAKMMADQGVGFLPICDANRRPIGVVTDRDIATRAVAKGVASERMKVTSIMTAPAITCLADSKIGEAEDVMALEQKARLVIIEKDGRVAGILSLADLLEHAPAREALRTVRAVLWREALGPRGGAAVGSPLLKDDPAARAGAAEDAKQKELGVRDTVMTGGHRPHSTKEFPS